MKYAGFYMFLIAGALVVASKHFNLPWLSAVAIMLIGIIALFRGIEVIVKGKATMGKMSISNPDYIERYRGFPARLMGMIISAAGLVFISLSIAGLLYKGGANEFLIDLLDSKYGLPLILGSAGLIGLAWGVVRFMTGTATAPGTHPRYIEFGIKLSGASLALFSLFMLVLAIAEFLQPGLLSKLFNVVVEWVKGLLQSLM